jgi:hypothetical protein
MVDSNFSREVRQQLEYAFVNNMERNFGGFDKFDRSMRRIQQNAQNATDEQLLRGANASQQQLREWAREPGESNVYWYH